MKNITITIVLFCLSILGCVGSEGYLYRCVCDFSAEHRDGYADNIYAADLSFICIDHEASLSDDPDFYRSHDKCRDYCETSLSEYQGIRKLVAVVNASISPVCVPHPISDEYIEPEQERCDLDE